ncbi:putative cytochrome CYP56B1 [Aspergillus nidulans FGSC A4]|uniref:Cytochrome P450, putative (Eurofung) n=1 Tax=Emericella nidulans (strain FGSC A4 / ATCC 38163 / CBS 112.46 / NRRL 194 / M139) TaxID=227321 RepID=C8VKB2_EMENI|nr:putative cytochrome CYP56B1 [Aspergillus nidulans FGSC A4]CBF84176.1 TPA: cytochrome P450, putative (Eurofung) [Aspergillus nidulans FGSC A4]
MLVTLTVLFLGLVGILASFLTYLFTPPQFFPKGLPTIPFYYTLIPLLNQTLKRAPTDQVTLYHRYLSTPLRTHGAVKLFFGGRWNILITKPSYIAEVLKNEDLYAKSGNQKKIPHSVLAQYTGDNIISSHGENWKLYSSIFKPGLQRDYDPSGIWRNASLLVQMISQDIKRKSPVDINPLMQRYALANLSEVLLGTTFDTLQKPAASLHAFQLLIKPKIFDPIFLNFPVLDYLPLQTREEARKLVTRFTDELIETVRKGHTTCDHEKEHTRNLGCRLLYACESGLFTEMQLRHNMISAFLAGHENPQLLLVSSLFLLAEHPEMQESLRAEISALNDLEPAYNALSALPLLTSTIYEVLRLYPPISQLINRRTTAPTLLGGEIPIPAGTYVGYNAYATNRDIGFWGPDANEFKPSRWGNTMEEINALFRRANAKGAFISFHGGRRTCLGQRFALLEGRVTLAKLLMCVRWEIDPSWQRGMTPAGPLYARNLQLRFSNISGAGKAGAS